MSEVSSFAEVSCCSVLLLFLRVVCYARLNLIALDIPRHLTHRQSIFTFVCYPTHRLTQAGVPSVAQVASCFFLGMCFQSLTDKSVSSPPASSSGARKSNHSL